MLEGERWEVRVHPQYVRFYGAEGEEKGEWDWEKANSRPREICQWFIREKETDNRRGDGEKEKIDEIRNDGSSEKLLAGRQEKEMELFSDELKEEEEGYIDKNTWNWKF